MPKANSVDLERFTSIRERIVDLYQYSGQAIKDKKTITTCAIVFGEQRWLVEEIERMAKGPIDDGDKARYEKVKNFVLRVSNDYSGAIKAGEFIKVSAAVFGASRFLIRCLERIVMVDDESAAARFAAARMPDEKEQRIELAIDDDVIDSPEEADAAIKAVGVRMPDDDLPGS